MSKLAWETGTIGSGFQFALKTSKRESLFDLFDFNLIKRCTKHIIHDCVTICSAVSEAYNTSAAVPFSSPARECPRVAIQLVGRRSS